ncbi:MAG: hypothetical protein K2H64_12065 [Desulfovibrio sp.]|nr:hypothetical protein [Desulfovibrio sp.]
MSPKKTVQGFGGVYEYFSLGDFSGSYFLAHGSNEKSDPQIWYPDVAIKRCFSTEARDPDAGFIKFMTVDQPQELEAALSHGDVLPALWKGQSLDLSVVLIASSMDLPVPDRPDPGILLFPIGLDYGSRDNDRRLRPYILSSKIKKFSRLKFGDDKNISHVIAESPIGDLDIIYDTAGLGESEKLSLAPGDKILVSGFLLTDAAVGPLADGAEFNTENDLIVLSRAFEKLDFSRCHYLFARDCYYIANGEIRAVGPDAIIDNFEKTARMIREQGHAYTIKFGALTIEDLATAGNFTRGQKCLLFINPDNTLLNAIFVWTNDEGKIKNLESVYYFEREMGVYVSDNIQDWLKGRENYDVTPDHDD